MDQIIDGKELLAAAKEFMTAYESEPGFERMCECTLALWSLKTAIENAEKKE